MALSKKPVNGMKDILPKEMEIRDYVTGVIKDTYRSFGFTPIETPCMENIANLSNKQGGENEIEHDAGHGNLRNRVESEEWRVEIKNAECRMN